MARIRSKRSPTVLPTQVNRNAGAVSVGASATVEIEIFFAVARCAPLLEKSLAPGDLRLGKSAFPEQTASARLGPWSLHR